MKKASVISACLFSAALMLPAYAYAQGEATPKGMGGLNCPMTTDTTAMQKDLGTMMKDVDGMMKGTLNAAMKDHLQKMHDQMTAMMVNMQKMGGMMAGGMMQGGQQPGSAAQSKPDKPSVSPEDQDAHHPQ